MTSRLRREEGVTVIELMVATAIFMILLLPVLSLLDSGTRTERANQVRHDALVDLRGAMTRITKDVRQALSIDPASSKTKLDMTTIVGGVDRRVIYQLSGGTLTRSIDGGTPGPLAERVTSTEVFCYDPPDCTLTAPPADPSSVRVAIALEPVVFSGGPLTLATDVELRNI
ncbi:MAG: prepilin-type N-terminal cleavage/methylation domain-containing protein [Actinomycetota bacterium]